VTRGTWRVGGRPELCRAGVAPIHVVPRATVAQASGATWRPRNRSPFIASIVMAASAFAPVSARPRGGGDDDRIGSGAASSHQAKRRRISEDDDPAAASASPESPSTVSSLAIKGGRHIAGEAPSALTDAALLAAGATVVAAGAAAGAGRAAGDIPRVAPPSRRPMSILMPQELSHDREVCPVVRFKDLYEAQPSDARASALGAVAKAADPRATAMNVRRCALCYCCICDSPASSCAMWETGDFPHCHATRRLAFVRRLRELWQSKRMRRNFVKRAMSPLVADDEAASLVDDAARKDPTCRYDFVNAQVVDTHSHPRRPAAWVAAYAKKLESRTTQTTQTTVESDAAQLDHTMACTAPDGECNHQCVLMKALLLHASACTVDGCALCAPVQRAKRASATGGSAPGASPASARPQRASLRQLVTCNVVCNFLRGGHVPTKDELSTRVSRLMGVAKAPPAAEGLDLCVDMASLSEIAFAVAPPTVPASAADVAALSSLEEWF